MTDLEVFRSAHVVKNTRCWLRTARNSQKPTRLDKTLRVFFFLWKASEESTGLSHRARPINSSADISGARRPLRRGLGALAAHAHASHSLDRGAPIHLVQQTLGPASVATTWCRFPAAISGSPVPGRPSPSTRSKASRSGTVSCTPAGGSQYRGLRARTARAPSGCFHERLTTATV